MSEPKPDPKPIDPVMTPQTGGGDPPPKPPGGGGDDDGGGEP